MRIIKQTFSEVCPDFEQDRTEGWDKLCKECDDWYEKIYNEYRAVSIDDKAVQVDQHLIRLSIEIWLEKRLVPGKD